MNSRFKTIAAAILLLGTAACKQASTPAEKGRAYFIGLGCKTCHAIGLEGGQVGPDLTFVGFRKTPAWMEEKLQDPVRWRPNSPMPKFNLQEPIRKSLVEYLASLNGDIYLNNKPWDDPKVKDDPVKRGETIYNRAGCVGCHGAAGKGGFVNNNVVGGKIPSLINVSDGYSKEEAKERIRNGKKSDPENASLPAPMIEMPAWGKVLKEDELDSLVEYLFSLKPKSAKDDWAK